MSLRYLFTDQSTRSEPAIVLEGPDRWASYPPNRALGSCLSYD